MKCLITSFSCLVLIPTLGLCANPTVPYRAVIQARLESPEPYMGVPLANIEVFPTPEGRDHIGELQAWDLAAGKKVWTKTFKSHNGGPVLATAGGLVFSGGTNDRYCRTFDAHTGDILWQQRTNSGVVGVPTSDAIDGQQYIAVQSGWGVDAQRKQAFLDKAYGTKTPVPQGGVRRFFGLPPATPAP